MKNKDNVKELLEYFKTVDNREVEYDEEAIAAAFHNNEKQSLAIKVLSVLGGFLASFAFIGFLLIIGLYNSGIGLLIFGALFIAGTIWVTKEVNKSIFATAGVSCFIVGFVLIAFGLYELKMAENTISVVFIFIALLSLCVVQDYILSFVSVLIINGSILILATSNNSYSIIHIYVAALTVAVTYLFLKEAKVVTVSTALSKLYSPLRIGLIFSFFSGLTLLSVKGILSSMPGYTWLPSVVIISAIIYLLPYLFSVLNINNTGHKWGICAFSVLVLLPTVLSPAISGALLVILLCFLVNYKTGLVVGLLGFIYAISQYYYDLNFTLLTKSVLLFCSGILFIALYWFTYKKLH